MLFSGRKIGNYLERRADAATAADLVGEGILSRNDRFRAVSLCRNDLLWAKRLRKAVRLVAAAFLVFGMLLLPASRYRMLFSPEGFYGLGALFIVLAVFSRFPSIWNAVAEYACVFLIGVLVFLPDPDFNAAAGIWRPFALWTFLLLPWSALSRRTGIKSLFCLSAAVSLFLYAFQVGLPTGTFGWQEFVYVFSAFNGAAVFALEFLNGRVKGGIGAYFSLRFVFEGFFLLSALILPVQTCFGLFYAPEGFLWAAFCSAAAGAFGVFFCPRAAIHKVNAAFFLCWSALGLFTLLNGAFEKQAALLLFSVLFFGLTLAAGGVERLLIRLSEQRRKQ